MEPTRDHLTRLIANPAEFLTSEDPTLRRLAVSSLDADQAEDAFDSLAALAQDDDPTVRTAAVEKLGAVGYRALEAIDQARSDPEPTVREALATAYGAIGASTTLEWLTGAATDDPDRAVREAAVAAMGAIGEPSAVDSLLVLVGEGPPQVRRRAIAAITVFDDPRIEPALERAALDRNPGVREAAEMIVGRQLQ